WRNWRLLLDPLDCDFFHDHIGDGTIPWFCRFCLSDFSYNIDPLDDLSEHSVAPIEVRGRRQCDEKLTAVCIGAGVGHRKNASIVVVEFRVEFIREAIARAAHSGPARIARLTDEAIDDPVDDE